MTWFADRSGRGSVHCTGVDARQGPPLVTAVPRLGPRIRDYCDCTRGTVDKLYGWLVMCVEGPSTTESGHVVSMLSLGLKSLLAVQASV